jgi:predicted ATPase
MVGINEAGKSNILKAFALIDPAIELSKNDIRDPAPDEDSVETSIVRFIFTLTPEEQKEVEEKARTKILSKNKNAHVLTIGENESSIAGFIKHKSEALYIVNLVKPSRGPAHWTLSGPKYRILPEWKKVAAGKTQEIDSGKEKINISSYTIVNTRDYPEIDPANLEDLDIGKLNLFIGTFFTDIVTKKLPKCISWTYKDSLLLPGKIDLSGFRATPAICLPLKIMFNLAGHENVTKTIDEAEAKTNGIKNLFKRVSEVTTAHMRKVWPEWNKLKVQINQNGEFIEAGIEDEFNFYSLDRRSDGFKRFFTFLLMMSAQNKTNDIMNNIILIDEPEIGLHPSGQAYLKDELIKISRNNVILISTHSIFMIDKEQIDRHLIVTKKKEVTDIQNVESSIITEEEVVFKALGYSLFEMLRPKNIIFEGWRDKRVFDLFIKAKGSLSAETRKLMSDAGQLHSLGVKDVPRIANMCENLNRDYIIISDSDKPALERQKDHDGQGKWFTYRDIAGVTALTTEDFVSKKNVNKAIRDTFREHKVDNVVTIGDELDSGYIAAIERHLKTITELPINSKKLMNDLKDHIIENLKADDLIDSYKLVVGHILSVLFVKNSGN